MFKAIETIFEFLIIIPLMVTTIITIWWGCIKIIKWLWNK